MAAFAEDKLNAAGVNHTWSIHAGSGVALIKMLAEDETELETAGAVELTRSLIARCKERSGSLVVERVPAALKDRLPPAESPGSDYPIMKRIKQELDPEGILNPGRLFGDL
jgi:glycolate oxidase FAD binding subunit